MDLQQKQDPYALTIRLSQTDERRIGLTMLVLQPSDSSRESAGSDPMDGKRVCFLENPSSSNWKKANTKHLRIFKNQKSLERSFFILNTHWKGSIQETVLQSFLFQSLEI